MLTFDLSEFLSNEPCPGLTPGLRTDPCLAAAAAYKTNK